MSKQDINGQWRGHYTYRTMPDRGSGFDAVFYESLGTLEGSIKDDVWLGEAALSGTFSFPSVRFTKVYMSQGLDPIHYEGTMSDDGKSIKGNWTIYAVTGTTLLGNWSAHRIDDAEEKDRSISTEKVMDEELEKVQ